MNGGKGGSGEGSAYQWAHAVMAIVWCCLYHSQRTKVGMATCRCRYGFSLRIVLHTLYLYRSASLEWMLEVAQIVAHDPSCSLSLLTPFPPAPQVIRDILASNHFGVGEGELRHIMGSLMRQADVVDGQVVDFRRFLTAVRPRVWYEMIVSTFVAGTYHTLVCMDGSCACVYRGTCMGL